MDAGAGGRGVGDSEVLQPSAGPADDDDLDTSCVEVDLGPDAEPRASGLASEGGAGTTDADLESSGLLATVRLDSAEPAAPDTLGRASAFEVDYGTGKQGKARGAASDGSSWSDGNPRARKTNWYALILSAVFGNVLEWYDFGVFASFSTELSQAFFTGGEMEKLLEVYGVFAAAFVARPVGGVLLGVIGDKFGRTLSLQISVVTMGLCALFIAVLPTNDVGSYAIGTKATWLLVSARVLQGLSVGGEMVGSMLYMVEQAPEGKRTLVSGVPMASACAGTAVGYLVSTVITALTTEEERVLWGWRVAFAIGFPTSCLGLAFRMYMHEATSFEEAKEKFQAKRRAESGGGSGAHTQNPFVFAAKRCPLALLTHLVVAGCACSFYSSTVWYLEAWMAEFYTGLLGARNVDKAVGRAINTAVILTGLTASSLLWAHFVVDKHPKVPIHAHLMGACAAFSLASAPLLLFVSAGSTCLPCVIFGHFLSVLCFVPMVACLPLWVAAQFPPVAQFTCMALSYNIAQAAFGGTVPYVATRIHESSAWLATPALYLAGLGLIAFAAIGGGRASAVQDMRVRMEKELG